MQSSHSYNIPTSFLESLQQQSSMVSATSFAPAQPLPALFREIDSFLAQNRRVSMGASAPPARQEMQLPPMPPLRTMNNLPPVPKAPKRSTATSRKNLRMLVLVKILVKDLERSGDIALKQQVKDIVKECNRQRRNQGAGFPPLEEAVELLLKGTVGVARWSMAKQQLDAMMSQRRLRLFGAAR